MSSTLPKKLQDDSSQEQSIIDATPKRIKIIDDDFIPMQDKWGHTYFQFNMNEDLKKQILNDYKKSGLFDSLLAEIKAILEKM